MYRIEFERNKTARFIKKAYPELRERLEEEILKIAIDPYASPQLTGQFKGLWSHHFRFKGTDYRIGYTIYENKTIVAILHIGTRENFYEELRRTL